MKVYLEPELMGIFGLSWQEKIASLTMKKVKESDKDLSKKLSDFFQAGGLNVRLIENMYREYSALMAQNYRPANFENGIADQGTITLISMINKKLNVDPVIIEKFLLSLYELSAAGKIPFSKWNPAGYRESTNLQKTFPSEVSILEKAGKVTTTTAKTGTIFLILAGIGVSLYYLNNIERFKSYGKRT